MYIAFDFDADLKAATESSDKEKTYELPGGNITTVDSELLSIKSPKRFALGCVNCAPEENTRYSRNL